jgi:hypothetical protein
MKVSKCIQFFECEEQFVAVIVITFLIMPALSKPPVLLAMLILNG